jgi:DNA polymerase/3'-5' exonuclease PolX
MRQKIPRIEIQWLEKYLQSKNIIFTMCGSYRRGKEHCGDIDIVVESKFFPLLLNNISSFIVHSFTDEHSKSKYMCLARFPHHRYTRRLDILHVPHCSLAASILYFTGSFEENIRLRKIAIKKGYKLNEFGLYNQSTPIPCKNEREIYEMLGEPFKKPSNR